MLAKIQTCTISGVDAQSVAVEIYMHDSQLPGVLTVGLPDPAVRESKDRVYAALTSSGYPFPLQKITINLAPANLRKEGSSFDLPIAVGLLCAMGVIRQSTFDEAVFIGELSLDGKVRPIRGVLPIAAGAYKQGWKKLIVPMENVREAAVVEGLEVFGVHNLRQVVDLMNGVVIIPPASRTSLDAILTAEDYPIDFADVKGQEHAKRALEVAAAGGHNILMIGPPGSGKTMLARRITTILPSLTLSESLDISKIHSICGQLDPAVGLVTTKPFRAPHHSISDAGLIGGGTYPMPGEVSLAHHGVLFLDELPEFKRHVLEVLRQPLEDGQVTISRAQITLTYPARFMLIAAMNPCPCGYRSHSERVCRCSAAQIDRYLGKISGPLLDRIDIHIEVASAKFHELTQKRLGETSTQIRSRIESARMIQVRRFGLESFNERQEPKKKEARRRSFTTSNSQMVPREIRKFCALGSDCISLMEQSMKRLGLSARAYDRIVKVSRTIADLDQCERIEPRHLAEAIQYRALDRSHCMPVVGSV